jgi:hypothetical protein
LSEDHAVFYRNIELAEVISSPDHPAWQWLAKRSGRIAGLSLELHLDLLVADQMPGWTQPLQTLSGIPGVQLRVEWEDSIADVDEPCIAQWLQQHGHLISHLTAQVEISVGRLTLRQFSEAAAACRSIDLAIQHFSDEVVDLSDLDVVAGSLQCLKCEPIEDYGVGNMTGTSSLNSMSQLYLFHCDREDFGNEQPWDVLAKLTSLQRVHIRGCASGDPSPLSALTQLSGLHLESYHYDADDQTPFRFRSLDPLSTLQELTPGGSCLCCHIAPRVGWAQQA